MKSVLQNYSTGKLEVIETPPPQLRPGWVMVRTICSLISAGTEKTKVDAGSMSLFGKAKARPDLVRQVIDKAKREGVWKTWQTVSDRLNTPVPMGYSSAGEVILAEGDVDLRPGDLVACAGSTANHAEIVCVPKNLAVRIPDGVPMEHAAFATLGAIAMQGVRQADARVGERIAVIGLGLVGLLTVQIAKAAGCRVFGIDIDPRKLELGKLLGCESTALASNDELADQTRAFTGGYGVDAAIITAATMSNIPIEQAAEITREKGRVVVVGLTKMDIPREPFYMKELDLRLSRSYGPGRYDKDYEEHGHDYPYAYVRFTEQRNMSCFLELVQNKQVRLDAMITHRFSIDAATEAYDLLGGERKEPYLGILLEYRGNVEQMPKRIELRPAPSKTGKIVVGVIGAGKYAVTNLIPSIRDQSGLVLGTVCTASGITAVHVGEKLGFAAADSDLEAVIARSDAILIGTRHNDHAPLVIKALQAGKPVFVEKPLAINRAQLDDVVQAADEAGGGIVMVGFNRRFAPATQTAQEHLAACQGPRQILIRVNAGVIPRDHWIQDLVVGGGRLIGEGCHFVDLAAALAGAPITSVFAQAIPRPNLAPHLWDDFAITLRMADETVATIVYTSLGDSGLNKEYVEVHAGGKSVVIDDFKRVQLCAGGKVRRKSWWNQDKGQRQEIRAWAEGLRKGESPIPFDEIINVHQACFAAVESIRDGTPVTLGDYRTKG